MGKNLGERPAALGLGHVPFGDRQADLLAKLGRARANPAQRADDQNVRPTGTNFFSDMGNQSVRVRKGRNRRGDPAFRLCRPAESRHSRACKPCPVAECRDTASAVVGQILQIVERPAACVEPVQKHLARRLALVGMAKHDVAVRQGRAVVGKLFEAKDDRVLRRGSPASFRCDRGPCCAVAVDRNGSLAAFLDGDGDLDFRSGDHADVDARITEGLEHFGGDARV